MNLHIKTITVASLAILASATTTSTVTANITPSPYRTDVVAQTPTSKNTTVIPGKRVGAITKKTKRADLVKMFGASRLTDETTRFFGGDVEYFGTVVKQGKNNHLTVLWEDKNRVQIAGVIVDDPAWKTPEGVGVGTTLSTLRQKFGEFKLSGFGWDYGGIPNLQGTKLSSYVGTLTLRMDLSESAYQKYPQLAQSVSGDQQLSASDRRLQRLGVRVNSMIVFLK